MGYFETKYGIKVNPDLEEFAEEHFGQGKSECNPEKQKKTFEQECAECYFEFNPNRSFEERCEIARRTTLKSDMNYEERMAMLKRRYGL